MTVSMGGFRIYSRGWQRYLQGVAKKIPQGVAKKLRAIPCLGFLLFYRTLLIYAHFFDI